MTPEGITGAILAGGESRRMGGNKPFVIYKGKPLIQWVYDAMVPVCDEILVIANSGDYSFLNARVIMDNFPGAGPAAGIEAALAAASHSLVLTSSCDTPNLSPDFYRYLIKNHRDLDVSIAGLEEYEEPLIGLYHTRIHKIYLESLRSGNNRPREIISQLRRQVIRVYPGDSLYRTDLFLNLNSPQDLLAT